MDDSRLRVLVDRGDCVGLQYSQGNECIHTNWCHTCLSLNDSEIIIPDKLISVIQQVTRFMRCLWYLMTSKNACKHNIYPNIHYSTKLTFSTMKSLLKHILKHNISVSDSIIAMKWKWVAAKQKTHTHHNTVDTVISMTLYTEWYHSMEYSNIIQHTLLYKQ